MNGSLKKIINYSGTVPHLLKPYDNWCAKDTIAQKRPEYQRSQHKVIFLDDIALQHRTTDSGIIWLGATDPCGLFTRLVCIDAIRAC